MAVSALLVGCSQQGEQVSPTLVIPPDSTTDPAVVLTGTSSPQPIAPEALSFLGPLLEGEGATATTRCDGNCSEYVDWAASNFVGLRVCVQRGDELPVVEQFTVAIESTGGRLVERVRTATSCDPTAAPPAPSGSPTTQGSTAPS